MIVMTTLTKSSPAIRCGEPEDIMNGILERKCQVFINITNTIVIVTTIIITTIIITTIIIITIIITTIIIITNVITILITNFQTFGCRISYACEPGYQLLGRTHRSLS